MYMKDIVDIVKNKSTLRHYKKFNDTDTMSKVHLATSLNGGWYSPEFLKNLTDNDTQIFEYDEKTNLQYVTDGIIRVSVCIYLNEDKFILKILKYSDDTRNIGYEFKTQEELINVLKELGFDKK